MKNRHFTPFILCIIIWLLSGSFFQVGSSTTGNEVLDTNMKYNLKKGDWLGFEAISLPMNTNGTLNETLENKKVMNVVRADTIGNKFYLDVDIYNQQSIYANFPLQDEQINTQDWDFNTKWSFTYNNTRKGLVNIFGLPDDLKMNDVYVEIDNMKDYYVFPFTPFEGESPEERYEDEFGTYVDEIYFYDVIYDIYSTESMVSFTVNIVSNVTILGVDDIVFRIDAYFIINLTLNPFNNIIDDYSALMYMHQIGYNNGNYSDIVIDEYMGSGTELRLIYDSNPHRGEWFYENWQWFVPTILIATVGIFVLVWWQLSVKNCSQGIGNTFCRDGSKLREKYKEQFQKSLKK